MKILSGHLTNSQKKAIKAILALNLLSGIVGKSYYQLSLNEGIYTAKITVKDRGLIPVSGSKLRLSTYKSTFTI